MRIERHLGIDPDPFSTMIDDEADTEVGAIEGAYPITRAGKHQPDASGEARRA
jgi:hypothetical protein